MKFGRPPPVVRDKPPGFYELAQAHVETHGGQWFVIYKHAAPQQWRAWMAYFAWLDDQTPLDGRKAEVFDRLDAITAPTAWPVEFDASAPPTQPSPPSGSSPSPSLERRRELTGMLSNIIARASLDKPRKSRWMKLDDLRDAYTAHAPVKTPELARYLDGMRVQEGAYAGDQGGPRKATGAGCSKSSSRRLSCCNQPKESEMDDRMDELELTCETLIKLNEPEALLSTLRRAAQRKQGVRWARLAQVLAYAEDKLDQLNNAKPAGPDFRPGHDGEPGAGEDAPLP